MGDHRMSPEEANDLAEGIRLEWAVLASMLEDAQDHEAWTAAGFDRPTEWLGDLPVLPNLTLHVGGVGMGALPANHRQARVSRPGRNRDVRATRRTTL